MTLEFQFRGTVGVMADNSLRANNNTKEAAAQTARDHCSTSFLFCFFAHATCHNAASWQLEKNKIGSSSTLSDKDLPFIPALQSPQRWLLWLTSTSRPLIFVCASNLLSPL